MEPTKQHHNFTKSLDWLEQASTIIPGGCSTLAKTPERLFPGFTALCCAEANGANFTDIDGNEWLDCEMAMGTVPWGHARVEVTDAIIQQLTKGTSFSTAADLELEAAKLILKRFDERYKMLKFAKGGADVVSAAIRVSRAYSGKSKVIATGYHGWHDWSAYGYYGENTEALGLPPFIRDTTYFMNGDAFETLKLIKRDADDIACIVLCPNEWKKEELSVVVDSCKQRNITVIFDEVTSGIRMGKQATAGEYDIWPDILCLSKGMANGLPLAVIMGGERWMKLLTDVRFSAAHASETIALAALIACEQLIQQAPVWPSWRARTTRLIHDLKEMIELLEIQDLELQGTYASFCIRKHACDQFYNDPFREFLVKRLAKDGIFSKGFFVFSDSHTDADYDRIQQSIQSALQVWSVSSKEQIK
ncbi:aminotransferase class III-fold pyridoxal phosphate-dependent enzyme [Paenibacillus sp. FSL R10-2734]|uniref:aminotransferase class III-fold pyridoxal phosphate-dependent enzyme n=1 Tax=Paenibacillus sp. FSL R10-2734 TaxID=2954691 RepID=UPI0030DD3D6D